MSWNVIANILIIAICSSCFSDFLDDCFKEDMIFERWGKFVEGKFWLKPLGGCAQCMNVWIALIMFLLSQILITVFYIFALIGLSNTILKRLWK